MLNDEAITAIRFFCYEISVSRHCHRTFSYHPLYVFRPWLKTFPFHKSFPHILLWHFCFYPTCFHGFCDSLLFELCDWHWLVWSDVVTLQIRQNTLVASLVRRPSLTIRMIAILWTEHTLPINCRICLMDSSGNLCSVQNVTTPKLTWYVNDLTYLFSEALIYWCVILQLSCCLYLYSNCRIPPQRKLCSRWYCLTFLLQNSPKTCEGIVMKFWEELGMVSRSWWWINWGWERVGDFQWLWSMFEFSSSFWCCLLGHLSCGNRCRLKVLLFNRWRQPWAWFTKDL